MLHKRIFVTSLVLTALLAAQVSAQTPAKKKVMKDEDIAAVGGTGVPLGYVGRTDRPNQRLSDAKYVKRGNGWDVTTGPAHILYNPSQTASGSYTVSATIDQLANPAHPESYGIFIGGSGLTGSGQTYLYFNVRGTGEFLVKTRNGDNTASAIDWKTSSLVPKADASGRASYKLAIQVASDSVKFWVNGHQVAALPKGTLPTNGIYGLRINHNLKLHVTPVSVTRR
jgi:hypothetical protein